MARLFRQAAIIGVGLIGGSLGMILRRKGLASSVVGIGRRIENLKLAVKLGAIDHYVVDAKEGVKDADVVVLATPVDTYQRHFEEWGSYLKSGAIVSDVGSVKGELVEQCERLMPDGVHFVGAHPIAGKEKTGVAAGSEDLFSGMRCIVTPTKQTNSQALEQVKTLWQEAESPAARRGLCTNGRLDRYPYGASVARSGRPFRRRVARYDPNRGQLSRDVARHFSVEPGQCGRLYRSV
jgi:prephenate dehydrogenase